MISKYTGYLIPYYSIKFWTQIVLSVHNLFDAIEQEDGDNIHPAGPSDDNIESIDTLCQSLPHKPSIVKFIFHILMNHYIFYMTQLRLISCQILFILPFALLVFVDVNTVEYNNEYL